MISYVFLCNYTTEYECLKRLLFGVDGKTYRNSNFNRIIPGDLLFLYNYEGNYLKGPYKSLTKCSKDIEPDAFWDYREGGFPYQIRVEEIYEKENIYENIRSYLGNYFYLRLDNDKTEYILKILLTGVKNEIIYGEHCYIFKCDKRTGGTVFNNNLMGAPIELFRGVVSRIRKGDIVFVWEIEEKKLYGIWEAIDIGKYNPFAFAEVERTYIATVQCERLKAYAKGIDNFRLKTLLNNINSLGKFPPNIIPKEEGELILKELHTING